MRRMLLAAVALAAMAPAAHAATPAYEYGGSYAGSDDRPFTIGFRFVLDSATTVDALGYNTINLPDDREVGLWSLGGTLIASTTVLATDPVTGHFAYHDIADVVLAPGAYVLAGTFEGGVVPLFLDGVTSMPGYTWQTDLQLLGSGLNYPTDSESGAYGQNGIAMVNFLAGPGAVPEPASWAMMIGGLALVGAAMRRRTVAVRFA